MIRRQKNVVGIAVLALLLSLIFVTIITNSTHAQSSTPQPTPAATRTYYCSSAAPASWRNPGCNWTWRTAAAAQQGTPNPTSHSPRRNR